MTKNSLSESADNALNKIYKEYIFCKNNNPAQTYHNKIFYINSIFHNSDDNDIMPSLIELSSKSMIRVFSDGRIMINDRAIPYIEKRLKKGLIDLEC